MFTRLSIALTVLALLGAYPLVAGEQETARSESLQKFRGLCETLSKQSSNPATKVYAERFLELSELRKWTNHAGKAIYATYLGNGKNAHGEHVIYLGKYDGSQYTVKRSILSAASQKEAQQLEALVPMITQHAELFRKELQRKTHEPEEFAQAPSHGSATPDHRWASHDHSATASDRGWASPGHGSSTHTHYWNPTPVDYTPHPSTVNPRNYGPRPFSFYIYSHRYPYYPSPWYPYYLHRRIVVR